ncbi:MAG: hypothetical protein IJY58_05930 [Alphaproteobacteria bacterium]|nr:hypothetical protein [Alphaproteobacteria bacterium]
MKKHILFTIGFCLLTSACATTGTDVAQVSTMTKLQPCLTEKAMQSLTDGSLYTNGLTATAKTIANSCLKSMAMERLGIDEQTTQLATTILSGLKATTPAQ